jgi:hypothetical protein
MSPKSGSAKTRAYRTTTTHRGGKSAKLNCREFHHLIKFLGSSSTSRSARLGSTLWQPAISARLPAPLAVVAGNHQDHHAAGDVGEGQKARQRVAASAQLPSLKRSKPLIMLRKPQILARSTGHI